MESISARTARAIAVAAQGLRDRRPAGRVDRRHGRAAFSRVGLIQIDSVNVLCRSQELVLFARLGDHPRDLIPRMTAAGELFEYWAHEASHLPVDLQPLLRWRMADAAAGRGTWGSVARIAHEEPRLVADVLRQVTEGGPITTRTLRDGGARTSGMWGWSPGKRALEYLFWSGQVTATRGGRFERRYDLPERVLPRRVLEAPTPAPADAQRALLRVAARCFGVATAADLADYFRLHVPTARRLVAELVEEGMLTPVRVEGWRDPAVRDPAVVPPRRPAGTALLSPFDSLIWNRSRTERLWGVRYRIEIYVPSAKRVHGYYVLPFILDGDLVARVDLKADRAAACLRVLNAVIEPHGSPQPVAAALAAELGLLAAFLGLGRVEVAPRGDLAAALARAVARDSA